MDGQLLFTDSAHYTKMEWIAGAGLTDRKKGRGGWSVISTQKDAADREFIIWYGLTTDWIQ